MASTVQGAIESKLLDAFDYRSMIKSIKKGNRKTVRLYPDNQQSQYNGVLGNKIKFNLPARGFLDVRNTTFNFQAVSTTTQVSSDVMFNEFIESLINKLIITLGDGSNVVEEIQTYNINAVSKYKNVLSSNYYESLATSLIGAGTPAVRNGWAYESPDGHKYAVPLIGSGLFQGALKYLPMGLLSMAGFNKSLVIEIQLEAPNYCMTKGLSNTFPLSYLMNNVFMELEIIECPEYEQELMNMVKGGKSVPLPYVTSNYWNFSITAAQQGDMTFSILQYNQYVHGLRCIFSSSTGGTTDYTNLWTRPAGIVQYQFQLNSRYYPSQPVELSPLSNANADLEKYKAFNKLKEYFNGSLISDVGDPTVTPLSFNALSGGFMLAQTLKTFYDNETFIDDSGDYLLDGVDTSDKSAIIFRLKTSSVQLSALYLHVFVDYQSAILIENSGVSVIN
jgi:hypothetical protein